MKIIRELKFSGWLYYFILFMLGMFSFSIPCFSNNFPFNYLSIGIAGILCIAIFIDSFFVIKKFNFSYYILSLLGFIVVIIISQVINLRFSSFPKSILLLSIVSLFIYQFSRNHQNKNNLFFSILLGGLAFCFVFIVYYRKAVFSFAFSSRVGDFFNDQNQLARMMCVYFIIAIVFFIIGKNKVLKLVSIFSSLLFLLVILFTGSISALITLSVVTCLSLIFMANKKSTRVLVIIIIFLIISLFIGIFFLPQMGYFKERIFGMLGSLFGIGNYKDNSSTSRFLLFINSIRMFLIKPIFGNGYFAVSEYNLYGITGHNNFAQLLADTGLLGFIAFQFQFVYSLFHLSFKKKENCVAKSLTLFLFIFQFFLTTYHQKMDYLIMPIVCSLIVKESPVFVRFEAPAKLSFKSKITYILNNCISQPLFKMRLVSFLSNLTTLKYRKYGRTRKFSSYKRLFDIEFIMKNGKSFSNEFYFRNCFYGHSYILKRYSGFKGKICASIEHGLYFGNVFMYDEISESPFKNIITFSGYRSNKIFKQCAYPTYSIGPYIAYASNVLTESEKVEAKKFLGKTLLVFPSHSIKGMSSIYDKDEFTEEIQKIRQQGEFKSVLVCLYYQDILNDPEIINYYKNKDFFVTTCGYRESKFFLDIQRTLFELCDVSMSNSVGTHVGYSIFLKKPHYIFAQTVKKDSTILDMTKEFYNDTAQMDRGRLSSYFNTFNERISDDQLLVCNDFFGFFSVKTKEELKEILQLCYLSMNDADILYNGEKTYEISI